VVLLLLPNPRATGFTVSQKLADWQHSKDIKAFSVPLHIFEFLFLRRGGRLIATLAQQSLRLQLLVVTVPYITIHE
jgi:hypothetical protein